MDERMRARRSILEKLASVLHDLRYAGRFLVVNPVFTGVAIATLALGIGATTAIFSLLDAALLRRPAIEDPESVVAVYTTCRLGAPRCSTSYPDYVDYRDRTEGLADLAVQSRARALLGDEGRAARPVVVGGVTGNFFSLLGVASGRGRLIGPDDDRLGAGVPVAVLSYALWRDHFASDPEVIGRTVRLSDTPYEVVGVAAAEYEGLTLESDADLWVPLQTIGAFVGFFPTDGRSVWEIRDSRWMERLVGRLVPGVGVEQVRAELLALSERMAEENPLERGPRSVTVDPLGRYLLPTEAVDDLPRFVWLLMGVVAATLLLACANLANLQLARASSRSGEMGVRVAIGAGRGRLVRQLLAESGLLSMLGGVAGLGLALVLLRLLGAYELPGGIPIGSLEAGLDARVLSVAALLVMTTAVLCGLAPALQATRPGVADALKAGRSPEGRRGGGRLRGGLVAAQVALCVVLLIGSGLFVRTLRSALSADLGFRAEDLSLLNVNLSLVGYDRAESFEFVQSMRERILERPGVRSVAAGSLVPILGGAGRGTFVRVDGYEPAPDEEMRIDRVLVTPGYFETLGVPMLAGRDFTPADATGEPVVVVSREMAERYWPEGRAVGGTFSMFGRGSMTVVGVVDDVHWDGLEEEPTNFVFQPMGPEADGMASIVTLVARTDGDPGALLPALREEARLFAPDLPVDNATTIDAVMGELLMAQRVGAALLTGFAVAAVLDGTLESFLYGIAPGDPLTYGTIAAGLTTVAALATVLPARAAARVDPLEVLRAE